MPVTLFRLQFNLSLNLPVIPPFTLPTGHSVCLSLPVALHIFSYVALPHFSPKLHCNTRLTGADMLCIFIIATGAGC
jgi:hypothetical protein